MPANHIFAMSGNRDNSSDSRVAPEDGNVGYVPMGSSAGGCPMLGSYDYLNARNLASLAGADPTVRFLRLIEQKGL